MALVFCPYDGALLTLDRPTNTPAFKYSCPNCRFVAPIKTTQHTSYPVTGSRFNQVGAQGSGGAGGLEEDDEFSEQLSQKGRATTQARCANAECPGQEAYFVQMQIRSADEPPTTFYECTKCKTRWRTD